MEGIDESGEISESEYAFRRFVRKRMMIGGCMLLAIPIIFIMVFQGASFFSSNVVVISVMLLVIVGFVGIIVLAYYAQGRSILYRGLKMLHRIAPPSPIIVGKYAVLNKDPVYIIVPWAANLIHFIKFDYPEQSFENKTKLPGLIWTWEYKHRIGSMKVAKREDTFTIPIDVETYFTGEGVLYSLPMYNLGMVKYPRDFSAEELNQVIESLALELKGDSSDLTSIDETDSF